MQTSLSRIEREYILRSLKDELPPLTLFINTNSYIITKYQFIGNTLNWETDKILLPPGTSSVQIHFMHKKHAMRFSAKLIRSGSRISCTVPQDIYPEEASRDLALDHIKIPSCNGFITAVFPINSPVETKEFQQETEQNPEKLEKLGKKIGLTTRETAAIVQLAAYLQGIQDSVISLPKDQYTGHIIHCDHRNLLMAFPLYSIAEYTTKNPFPITIFFTKRKIELTAQCIGTLSITDCTGVIAITYITAQEEDKRFLYEGCYKKKYTEIE
ncbi:MAG TPA: hypothetical protein GXZ47_09655 [Treponema sp.]|nr:hypothetical protein [Treponema sp.]